MKNNGYFFPVCGRETTCCQKEVFLSFMYSSFCFTGSFVLFLILKTKLLLSEENLSYCPRFRQGGTLNIRYLYCVKFRHL